MPVAGSLFDGRVAIEHAVAVVPAPGGWQLRFDGDGHEEFVAAADLRQVDRNPTLLRFAHEAHEGWRLSLPAPLDPALAASLGATRRWPRPHRLVSALAIGGGLISAAILAVIIAPEPFVRHLPLSVERRLGEGFDAPLTAARCATGAGPAALDRLVDRVDPTARHDGLRIEVVDLALVNAVTLPGGRIAIFRGLLDATPDSDAVAGILAHEIAHARRRHVAAALVRQFGLGLVTTLIGGNLAGQANTLVNLRFTRGAEAEADADSLAALIRADISPKATARVLRGFGAQEGSLTGWLSDHPASAARAARFGAAWNPATVYRAALSPADSAALHRICAH